MLTAVAQPPCAKVIAPYRLLTFGRRFYPFNQVLAATSLEFAINSLAIAENSYEPANIAGTAALKTFPAASLPSRPPRNPESLPRSPQRLPQSLRGLPRIPRSPPQVLARLQQNLEELPSNLAGREIHLSC